MSILPHSKWSSSHSNTPTSHSKATDAVPTPLTNPQRIVLFGLVNGMTVKQIAAREGCSIKAIHDRMLLAYKKIGVRNMYGALSWAARTGLVVSLWLFTARLALGQTNLTPPVKSSLVIIKPPDTNRYHLAFAWDPTQGAASYNFYACTKSPVWEPTIKISTVGTSLIVSNLSPGSIVQARVTTIDAAGVESDYSRQAPMLVRTYWKETSTNTLTGWRRDDTAEYLDPTNAVQFSRIVQSNWSATLSKD